MSIVNRPSASVSMAGGSIQLSPMPCAHVPAVTVSPWIGARGTAGTVAVIGAGKMGLPLAVQFAGHGWRTIAVDINRTVVEAINAGRASIDEEPGLSELVARYQVEGYLRATLDAESATSEADVVVVIVPLILTDDHAPDFTAVDAALSSIAPGLHRGATVILETTLPIGTTRSRYAPALEARSGLTAGSDFYLAFSPERLFSGSVLANLATYPKLVGGINQESTKRAATFYASVLDAEVVAMSSAEAAEFAKLADTTYRDVNIALANEFARAADAFGVDVDEVIAAANSQPYSRIHQPGIGVGGHCIPVYPHLLLSVSPTLDLVETARRINDGQVEHALDVIRDAVGNLADERVLILGLTYRAGVKELAYSVALRLIAALTKAGAAVLGYDPCLSDDEVRSLAIEPWRPGNRTDIGVVISQTDDRAFAQLDLTVMDGLRFVFDGRNSLRSLALPEGVGYSGVGVQAATRVRTIG